jgi:hypothetical protein
MKAIRVSALVALMGLGVSCNALPSVPPVNAPAVVQPSAPPLQTAASKVELRVYDTDDVAYVTVNGVRRGVYKYQEPDTGRLDISAWFADGANTLRLQAVNAGGGRNYSFQLWVDGALKLEEACRNACPDVQEGIIFDKSLTLELKAAAKRNVTITSPIQGDLYINNVYSGKRTPAQLELTPGKYTFGVGGDANGGRYVQAEITVDSSTTGVEVNTPVPLKPWKLAILPVRTTHHGDASPANTGVLTAQDIDIFAGQMRATSDSYVKPYSYGLTEWNILVLPVIEDIALERGASPGDAPDTGRLLEDAGLSALEDEYDTVVVLYSNYRADGSNVSNDPCCGWGGGKGLSIMNGFGVRGGNRNAPMEGYLHEWLHSVESYNAWLRYKGYNGVNGLHGGEEHGYQAPWLPWYKAYMRGQVGETAAMRSETPFPSIPASSDLYVGVLETLLAGPQGEIKTPRAP